MDLVPYNIDIDIENVLMILNREDAKTLDKITIRKAAIHYHTAAAHRRKNKLLHSVATSLSEIVERLDEVQSIMEDFLKDRQFERFEERLQNIDLSDKDEPDLNGLDYQIRKMKVDYAKVLSQVESLEKRAANAVDNALTDTAAGQPKLPQTLSPTLDTIISHTKRVLGSAKTIIDSVQNELKELSDLTTKTNISNQNDFNLLAAFHGSVHDDLDDAQRKVYDHTATYLSASQRARFPIERPVEGRNNVKRIRNESDLSRSVENIENRVKKLNSFSQEYTNMYKYVGTFTKMHHRAASGSKPAAGQSKPDPSQPNEPQAGPSQAGKRGRRN